MPLFDSTLTLDRYAATLRRLFGLVRAWEHGAIATAPEWLEEEIVERSRLTLLEQDLAHVGVLPPEDFLQLPEFGGETGLLGAMYVMEGSRLGGQLIGRHVERELGLTSGLGNAYFLGYGDRTSLMWRRFVELLTTRVPDDATDEVISGARLMFGTFGQWMEGAAVANVAAERCEPEMRGVEWSRTGKHAKQG